MRRRASAIRAVWAVLALATAGFAVFIGAEPMYSVTNCEILMAGQPDCVQSLYAGFGPVLLAVLAAPVLLCAAPAIWPAHATGWAAALGLVVASVFGAGTLVRMDGTAGGALGYFLPVALLAVVLAALYGPLSRWAGAGAGADPRQGHYPPLTEGT